MRVNAQMFYSYIYIYLYFNFAPIKLSVIATSVIYTHNRSLEQQERILRCRSANLDRSRSENYPS